MATSAPSTATQSEVDGHDTPVKAGKLLNGGRWSTRTGLDQWRLVAACAVAAVSIAAAPPSTTASRASPARLVGLMSAGTWGATRSCESACAGGRCRRTRLTGVEHRPEADMDERAPAGRVLGCGGAAVRPCGLLDDGQPEARARQPSRRGCPIEAIEDVREIGLVKARTVVAHRQSAAGRSEERRVGKECR